MAQLRSISDFFVFKTPFSKNTLSSSKFTFSLEEASVNTMVATISRKIEEILPQLIQEALDKYMPGENAVSRLVKGAPSEATNPSLPLTGSTPCPSPFKEKGGVRKEDLSFNWFVEERIRMLKKQKRKRTAENYKTALNSLVSFMQKESIPFQIITEEKMSQYQEWLISENLSMNTISCYLRTLRSIYNKAVKAGLVSQIHPFKETYTKIDETRKRAISASQMQRLKSLDLNIENNKSLTRDLFLFSFYTRGMSFIDMAYLQKRNIANGQITYKRQKTNQEIKIKLEPCMQKIIDRYVKDENEYIFPIISSAEPDQADTQYRSKQCYYNRLLKEVGMRAKIETPLSFYVARHTWASLAFHNKIDLEIISKALGHTSLKTTLIYIKAIGKESAINHANSKLIRSIFPANKCNPAVTRK